MTPASRAGATSSRAKVTQTRMRSRRNSAPRSTKPPAAGGADAVDRYLGNLEHPLKPAIEAVRAAILKLGPRIGEEIKWNSPSFYLNDHFATINTGRKTRARPMDHIPVVLHRGAKARPGGDVRASIDDPTGLAEWLGGDRCVVMFRSPEEVEARKGAFRDLLRQWIACL